MKQPTPSDLMAIDYLFDIASGKWPSTMSIYSMSDAEYAEFARKDFAAWLTQRKGK